MQTMDPRPTSTLISVATDARTDLEDAPIPVADIIDGAPRARSLTVGAMGNGLSVWLWDCTAGRFHWAYGGCDEIVHIIEGGVTVTDEQGGVVRLQAGDVATFAAGSTATWHVEEYVKKVAVTRNLPNDPLSRLARVLRGLAKRLLRR